MRARAVIGLFVLLAACDDDAARELPPDAGPNDAGTGGSAGSGGGAPCPPGELLVDEACTPAGVPPEACAAGFAPDGTGGCEPVLPREACGESSFAAPGETTCHEVAPCGSSPWGAAPTDASTQFVDATYAGGDSDGTEAKPWTTIQAGIDAATPGSVVAVAAGSYAEAVRIETKAVRLWGQCPAMVELVGPADGAALFVGSGAAGTEIHDVAVRGLYRGVEVSDAVDVVLDRLWMHHSERTGLFVNDLVGPASATLTRSLVEKTHVMGIAVFGAELDVSSTVVRDVLPRTSDSDFGRGITIQHGETSQLRSRVSISTSIVERCHEFGIMVIGSDFEATGLAVRDVAPLETNQTLGRGISAQVDVGGRPSVVLRGVVVERTNDAGISVAGGDATIEATTVRDTVAPPPPAESAYGISVHVDQIQTAERTKADVRAVLVERTEGVGVLVASSDATVERLLVRAGRSAPSGSYGRGINVQKDPAGDGSTATLRGSRFEGNGEFGVLILDSTATVEDCFVGGTVPNALGQFGDGLAVLSQGPAAAATATRLWIEDSARAGASNFGALLTLADTVLECNPVDLDGEPFSGADFQLEDAGGNRCGCKGAVVACQVLTTGIEAPKALP